MKLLLATLLMVIVQRPAAGETEHFACNMAALTKAERATHHQLSHRLLASVEEQRELRNGYAFRMPAKTFPTAAHWVSLERRCCPFFAFELQLAQDGGPMWLKVTGSQGIKQFIRAEFGLDATH